MTYALLCLCGWHRKIPPTTIGPHKNNKWDLCRVAVASISDKPSQWGVNAAPLIHGSLSMSFWTAEMSPSLGEPSAPRWTCHRQIITCRFSVWPSQMWKEQMCRGRGNIWNIIAQVAVKLRRPNHKIHAPLFSYADINTRVMRNRHNCRQTVKMTSSALTEQANKNVKIGSKWSAYERGGSL